MIARLHGKKPPTRIESGAFFVLSCAHSVLGTGTVVRNARMVQSEYNWIGLHDPKQSIDWNAMNWDDLPSLYLAYSAAAADTATFASALEKLDPASLEFLSLWPAYLGALNREKEAGKRIVEFADALVGAS